jgi:hypothetical protein
MLSGSVEQHFRNTRLAKCVMIRVSRLRVRKHVPDRTRAQLGLTHAYETFKKSLEVLMCEDVTHARIKKISSSSFFFYILLLLIASSLSITLNQVGNNKNVDVLTCVRRSDRNSKTSSMRDVFESRSDRVASHPERARV